MLNKNADIVLRGIIDRKGHKYQTREAIDSMQVLIRALVRECTGDGDKDLLLDSFADVMIYMSQVATMYNIQKKDIDAKINSKIDAMREDLENGN